MGGVKVLPCSGPSMGYISESAQAWRPICYQGEFIKKQNFLFAINKVELFRSGNHH